jgi:hypothetical protein
MQQNLPKSAQNCQNLPKDNLLGKLWNTTKKWDFDFFSRNEKPMCRRGTNVYAHSLDFWYYNNFGDVFSIVKKWPLFVNCSISHCEKCFFSQCSTPLVGLCRHVSNSPRDKNKMMHHPYLLEKVVFLASKTLLSPLAQEKIKIHQL